MKCIKCQKEIVSGMRFCPYCNTKQPEAVEKNVKQTGTKPFIKRKLVQKAETIPDDTPAQHIKPDKEVELCKEPEVPNESENNDNVDILPDVPEETFTSAEQEVYEPLSEYEELEDDSDDWMVAQVEKEDDESSSPINDKDVNKDGYYDDILPNKNESFPISRGELISKIVIFILLAISIILYLVYIIR